MTARIMGLAILRLKSNAQFIINGDVYSDIQWLDTEQTQPTLAEVEAEIANPTPQPELTVSEKLAAAGLSVADLKTALGL